MDCADGSYWIYGYDTAGQLRRANKFWSDHTAVAGQQFYYDSTCIQTNRMVYDGWNLVAEFDGASGALVRNYGWGLDLSGTLQGAGGIGGLLWVQNAGGTAHFPAFDGNGNIMGLVSGADGTATAHYEYGPFGEVIRQTGPMAKANPFRFSTKYTDEETELVYYGYRYYSPTLGRWLSRDSIGENGELNLYGFIGNNPISFVDVLGLDRYGNPVSGPNGPEGNSDPDPGIFLPPELRSDGTSCKLWIQRDVELPGHEVLVGVGHPENSNLRAGRDVHSVSGNWAVVIPEPGAWYERSAPLKNDYKQYTYYRVDLVESGTLKAGKAVGSSCKCAGNCENILDCLNKVTTPGTRCRFHGLGWYGDNCRTSIEAALEACCAKRGRHYTSAP